MRLADVILRGTRGSQPAATAVPEGTLYYVTDENVTERSTGAAWEDYSDGGTVGGSTIITFIPLTDPEPPDEPMMIPGPTGAQGAAGAAGSGGGWARVFMMGA